VLATVHFFSYIQFYILPLQTKALAAPAPLNSTQIPIFTSQIKTRHRLTIVLQTCHNDKKELVKQDSFRQHKIIHENSQLNASKTSNGCHKAKNKKNEALAKSKQEKCACKKRGCN